MSLGECMKILLTGSTGFVGSKLAEKLVLEGHELLCPTRNEVKAKEKLSLPVKFVNWDQLEANPSVHLSNIDGVIHLAGENVGEKRWSQNQKLKILNSRKITTEKMVKLIDTHALNCHFFIGASAIGYYSDSIGNNWIDEKSASGDHFLAQVCKSWEEPLSKLDEKIRLVTLRIGVVLGYDGGLIKKILPIYRKCLGGPVGSGRQWMSWIHVSDLVEMLSFSVKNDISGVFNAVAPSPTRYSDFNRSLGIYTQRPAFFPVPEFLIKLIMGEASYLALSSQRISSEKIQSHGFEFQFPDIDQALVDICEYKILPPNNKKCFHNFLRKVQYVDRPIEEVFDFFKEAKNLEQITPPFLNFQVKEQSTPVIEEGTRFKYQLKLHGLPISWTTIITEWEENQRFVDYQKTGPYHIWYHRHLFIPLKEGTLMVDEVRYRLPMGFLGDFFGLPFVKKDVSNIFQYRKRVIGDLL